MPVGHALPKWSTSSNRRRQPLSCPCRVRSAGQPVPGQVSYEHCVVIFITVQRLTVSSAPRWERPARAVAHHVVRDRPAPSRAPMPPRPARHRSLVAPNMRPGTAWPLPATPPHRTMCVLVSWHGYRLAGRFQSVRQCGRHGGLVRSRRLSAFARKRVSVSGLSEQVLPGTLRGSCSGEAVAIEQHHAGHVGRSDERL